MNQPPKSQPSLLLYLLWSEIKNSKGFAGLFVLNLSLGLIGFTTLDSFKSSVDSNLQHRSKNILAADLGITHQRPLTEAEEAGLNSVIPKGSLERREIGMFSMATAGENSRLVWIRAIDEHFPYYGTLELKSGKVISSDTPRTLITKPTAWLYPELQIQLGVSTGDKIKLGYSWFTVEDIIEKDPSVSTVSFVSVAKIYIGLPNVKATGLMKTGSRVYHSRYYKLKPDQVAKNIKESIRNQIPSTDIRITSHDKASPEFGQILAYLNDYLGLVSLVALFLAGVGSAFLFRSHLSKRVGDIAILLSLGVANRTARLVYIFHLVFLGTVSTAVTALLSLALLPTIPGLLGGLLDESYTLVVPMKSLSMTALLGIGGSLLFCFPLLQRIKRLNPSALFQEDASPSIDFSKKQLLGFLPVALVYWLLAMFQANSVMVGSLFVSIFFTCGILFTTVCWFSLRILNRGSLNGMFANRVAALNLARHKTATLACFLAISLGAMIVNIIPQIRDTILEELSRPNGIAPPSLFLFDIQDEQVAALKTLIKQNELYLNYLSPMIHARLSKVNGVAIKTKAKQSAMKTREQERSERMRNRTFNLSYRTHLASSEKIVEGAPFSGSYDWEKGGPAEMSVEIKFAERLDLELGSIMEFDIGGVQVQGKVVSLRRIKWTSFHPNFFVQFQDGLLNDAPKTFVASIPSLPFAEKMAIQKNIVAKFPNISVVDVSKTIERMLGLMNQITVAISFMAYLTLLAGMAVLFSIAGHQAHSRTQDNVLLKVLGCRFSTIKKIVIFEFAYLGIAAAALGAFVSVGVSYLIARILFTGAWVLSWQTPVYSIIAISILCIVTGYAATARSLQKNANTFLN